MTVKMSFFIMSRLKIEKKKNKKYKKKKREKNSLKGFNKLE